jgi:hypothetical protein
VEGTRFILVQTKRPYIQSSVACATTCTIDDQTRSRGYNQSRDGEEAPRSLIGVELWLKS